MGELWALEGEREERREGGRERGKERKRETQRTGKELGFIFCTVFNFCLYYFYLYSVI